MSTAGTSRSRARVSSLDAFRGTCIGVMIFVNYGGGGYWFFDHSKWNGLTWADLVFPWFIFIMGVNMPMSFAALQAKKEPTLSIVFKVVKRSIILFSLGLFLNNGYDTENWRILGVLQRFGVSYLAVSLIILFVPKLTNNNNSGGGYRSIQSEGDDSNNSSSDGRLSGAFRDIIPFIFEWVVIFILVGIWLLTTFLLEVPGCPKGYLGPGGLADEGKHWNCTGGAAGYVDFKIFGPRHIYDSPTCRDLYMTGSYDPEGTLGYLTSITLCYLGAQAGRVLVYYREHKQRIVRWVIWSLIIGLLGLTLCYGRKNEGYVSVECGVCMCVWCV